MGLFWLLFVIAVRGGFVWVGLFLAAYCAVRVFISNCCIDWFFVITLDIIDYWVGRLVVLGCGWVFLVWLCWFLLGLVVYRGGYFMLIWVWGFNCHCVIEVGLAGDLYFDCLA